MGAYRMCLGIQGCGVLRLCLLLSSSMVLLMISMASEKKLRWEGTHTCGIESWC
jgi:hypothetical protein